MRVAHYNLPTKNLAALRIPDRIRMWKCWFLWRKENWKTRRKTLLAGTTTNNKLNPHMTAGPESNPGHIGGRRMLSRLRHFCYLTLCVRPLPLPLLYCFRRLSLRLAVGLSFSKMVIFVMIARGQGKAFKEIFNFDEWTSSRSVNKNNNSKSTRWNLPNDLSVDYHSKCFYALLGFSAVTFV